MLVIKATDAHTALPEALYQMGAVGVQEDTRNGPALRAPVPVTTQYVNPCNRVIFHPERDANPFFHLFESLWMLAGRDDVAWIEQFNAAFGQFSDDGVTFHGAYGARWRFHFGIDQLQMIAAGLRADKQCRRQVLCMWDPRDDHGRKGQDLPCNDVVTFQVGPDGALQMVVLCRSNDIIWGCYGSNVVHFSMLHELMAAWVGVPVGMYWQVSVNWHAYLDTYEPLIPLAARYAQGHCESPYTTEEVESFPLVNSDIVTWHADLALFMNEGENAIGYRDRFFRRVALPLLASWRIFKNSQDPKRHQNAAKEAAACQASDWRKACIEWLMRKEEVWKTRRAATST